ncbi:hypothetical protein [Pseudomonas putida]|uniref:hypothetical protein n=1 Tax=Pseudomonas putida TaxID=303 RepID=UPI002B24263D|nr:hypothetical protein [Pseudomonas putida]
MNVTNIGLSTVVVSFSSVKISEVKSLRQTQHDVPFKCVQTDSLNTSAIEISIKDFSIYDDLVLNLDGVEIDLADAFGKYRLDQDRLADEFYITGAIINAATRGLDNGELFFVAYNALAIMPLTNHFYGALVTLVSYKYLEAPECRAWVVDVLLESKKRFDCAAHSDSPNVVRWGISSATALSLVLLLNDRVDDAECVIDSAFTKYEPNLNQLSYWNYCLCLILKATVLFHAGRCKDAGWKYLAAFDFSRKAINDIYHSRNDWVLGQVSDCHALLNLGELGMKCAAKSIGDIPLESRYADIKYGGAINFMPVFSRFQRSRSKFKSDFFDTVDRFFNAP